MTKTNSMFKRVLTAALAVMMLCSVFAVSASAANSGVGVVPELDDQLWYADSDFLIEFAQILDIDGVPEGFVLGYNTVQEIVLDDKADLYVLTTHPQYFGGVDYDDQVGAKYVMDIRNILVLDPATGLYVDCFEDGFATVPVEYTQYNGPGNTEPYLQCLVYSSIIELATGDVFDASWNGDVAYFAIPELP